MIFLFPMDFLINLGINHAQIQRYQNMLNYYHSHKKLSKNFLLIKLLRFYGICSILHFR